ncbi:MULTISPECIES: cyanoexosortase A [unclassified Anabaena]|uniref:cyanoexosortase A n=1 Tax=unclassified Anabaena TaxID=2619674 RepID=UPI00082FC563|nr:MULTISPECIES: cyanoexosortase A [unclassified Anabaena]
MKNQTISAFKNLKKHQFFVLGIASCLIAIIMTVTWRAEDVSQLGMTMLFMLAVGSMIWEKRQRLTWKTDIFSSVFSMILIACILWQSVSLNQSDNVLFFTHLSPFLSAIAIGLLASGWRGLRQYWQEIIVLFFLGVPELILEKLIYIAPLTANFATILLWYSGFDVLLHEEIYITLVTTLGSQTVKVDPGCSGIGLISYLLGVSILALVMFPIEKTKTIIVPIISVILAFFFNGIRVAIMAVLASKNQEFDFWHTGGGSQVIGTIAVLVFGLLYYLLNKQGNRENQVNTES